MVIIKSLFACINYVINPFVNLLVLSSNLAWRKGFAHPNGKKQMLYQFIKQPGKQLVKNWRPFSHFPISSKVLECIIYSKVLTYFIENNLISENQSGFKPGDSCINQLLAITHEIFSSFDANYKSRGVFLDISKVFDK